MTAFPSIQCACLKHDGQSEYIKHAERRKLVECHTYLQVEMEEAQKNLEKQLRREFEEELKDKEDALVARLVEDQEKLKDERNELEEKLKEENKASMYLRFEFHGWSEWFW